jgi:hypothetical protein
MLSLICFSSATIEVAAMRTTILILLLSVGSLGAQTHYYVDADCTTAGTGLSRIEAFTHIKEAFDALGTGGANSIVHVYDGTYQFTTGDDSLEAVGTASNWVRFIAEGDSVFITKSAFSVGSLAINGAQYVEFRGFNFETRGGGTDWRAGGVFVYEEAVNVVFRQCAFGGYPSSTDAGAMVVLDANTTKQIDISFLGCTFGSTNDAGAANACVLRTRDTVNPANGSKITFKYNTVWQLKGTRNDPWEGAMYITNNMVLDVQNNIFNDLEYDDTDVPVIYTDNWDNSTFANNAYTIDQGVFGAGTDYTAGDEGTTFNEAAVFVDRGGPFYQYTLSTTSDLRFKSTEGTSLGAIAPWGIQFGRRK